IKGGSPGCTRWWCLEICHHRSKTRIVCSRENFSCQCVRDRGDLASRTTEPMVCHRAREREPTFHNIKPVHAVFGRAHTPPRTKCADRRQITLTAIKKIAIQRKNHVGAIEFGNHARTSAERTLRGCDCSLTQ